MGQWTTEGLQWVLETVFSEQQSVPANFYVGLSADLTIAKSATLATLNELGQLTGYDASYVRQAIASDAVDWTSALFGTDNRQMISKTVLFAATGPWSSAMVWFLATTIDNSGKLLCWDSLDEEIQLDAGQTHEQVVTIYGTG